MCVEGEDVESEDCLGFLSSVALAEEEKWHNTHSGGFPASNQLIVCAYMFKSNGRKPSVRVSCPPYTEIDMCVPACMYIQYE